MNKKKRKELILKIQEIAEKNGATKLAIIDPSLIGEGFVKQWVRMKCQFGCGCYGLHFSCPPYTGSLKDTKRLLRGYRVGLLIEFGGLTDRTKQQPIRELMAELEKMAFLGGLEKAFALAGGPCRKCETCIAASASADGMSVKGKCAHPELMRPSMESLGINVFGLVHLLGWVICTIAKEEDPFNSYGLLLLD